MGFAYRFRPLNSLLGDRSELERSEIYLALPDELNDPVEGYSHIVWDFDDTSLKALLRHYLICLHSSIALSLLASDSPDDVFKNIVFWTFSKLPTQQLKDLIAVVFNRCLEDRAVILYFELMLSRRKPVSSREMTMHLSIFHFSCLPIMLQVLTENGLFRTEHIFPPDANASSERLSQVEGLREVFRYGSDVEVDFVVDNLLSSIDQMRIIASMNVSDEVVKHAFHRMILDYPNRYVAYVKRLVFSEWSTACFVRDPANTNMWSVYGDGHRGACLSFNTNDSGGDETLALYLPTGSSSSPEGSSVNYSWVDLRLNKVDYSGVYKDINFFSAISPFTESQLRADWFTRADGTISPRFYELFDQAGHWKSEYWQKMHQITLVKTRDWSHENELRLIYRSAIHDLSNPTMRLAKYRFSSLKGIVFGMNMSEDDRRKIINIVRRKCKVEQRKEFLFQEAFLDHLSGNLRLRNLPLIKVT